MAERAGDFALQFFPRALDLQLDRQRGGQPTEHLDFEELNKNFRESWTSIEYAMDGNKLKVQVDDKRLEGTCDDSYEYQVAMAAQNCLVEVFDLRVFVKTP